MNDLSRERIIMRVLRTTLKPRKRERPMAITRLIVTMKVCVSMNPPPPSKPLLRKRTEGWMMRLAEDWWTLVRDHFLWWLISSGFWKERNCGVGFNEEDERYEEEEDRSCREMRGRVAIESLKKKTQKDHSKEEHVDGEEKKKNKKNPLLMGLVGLLEAGPFVCLQ